MRLGLVDELSVVVVCVPYGKNLYIALQGKIAVSFFNHPLLWIPNEVLCIAKYMLTTSSCVCVVDIFTVLLAKSSYLESPHSSIHPLRFAFTCFWLAVSPSFYLYRFLPWLSCVLVRSPLAAL